jgi:glycine dehydrogenase subunit 2
MKPVFAMSGNGKNNYKVGHGIPDSCSDIPASWCRDSLALPDVNETEVVRHYTALSTLNFGVDSGMYPLGSCTMKYNPKINERVSSLEGFAAAHPLAPEELSQGSLRLMYELADSLSRITGMKAFTLMPAAGAHGELTSVMIIKKYFESLGQKRNVILIPDSAHGTNPASVAMCGFEVRSVPSKADGDVDLEALKGLIDEKVAAMMLTSPSTLGLFDRGITEIAAMLHANGSIFYCDGANLNAVMGVANIAHMGFDIMHINLHKTFSTPHGGGGPGSGPVGVVEKLLPFLPVPRVEKAGENYRFNYDCPSSIGRVHAFWGNFLIMVRAYAYIRMLGPEGVKSVSEHAVLNANYLRARLMKEYYLPKDRLCMHEFVLSDAGFPNHVTTNDISKRILDFGMHAPTVYFPLIVEGALMFEPTETESLDALDRLVDVMKQIKTEAQENPDLVKNAPHTTPVRRVDSVLAARKPILKWGDA